MASSQELLYRCDLWTKKSVKNLVLGQCTPKEDQNRWGCHVCSEFSHVSTKLDIHWYGKEREREKIISKIKTEVEDLWTKKRESKVKTRVVPLGGDHRSDLFELLHLCLAKHGKDVGGRALSPLWLILFGLNRLENRQKVDTIDTHCQTNHRLHTLPPSFPASSSWTI